MSSVSKKTNFFKIANPILQKKKKVDWFILKELAKGFLNTTDIYFSFHDKEQTNEYPFMQHQGYLCIKKNMEQIFLEEFAIALENLLSNEVALANMYIILSQISANDRFIGQLHKDYKRILSTKKETVYFKLIDVLNKEYFHHHYFFGKTPASAQDWLDIFKGAEIFHHITDPVVEVKKLVQGEKRLHLKFKWISCMTALVRAPLFGGWYHFKLEASSTEILKAIKVNVSEAAFIAAILLDDTGPDSTVPKWLNKSIVKLLIKIYWNPIGRELYEHVFGISFRNKNNNDLFKKLKELMHEVMTDIVQSENDFSKLLEGKLNFPNFYIAYFNWISDHDLSLDFISGPNINKLTKSFLDSLEEISSNPVHYISAESYSDPFLSYQLVEEKYRRALPYLLLYLLDAPEAHMKQFNKICFKFKPLYFGAYEANHLATQFTEFILHILFSIYQVRGLSEEMLRNLDLLLKSLSQAALIPYIHLTERNSEIWDSNENLLLRQNASRYLINEGLKRTLQSDYKDNFKILEDLWKEVKVAHWPYER